MVEHVDQDFTGRTAIVTGASRGIGRAIAEELGRRGANLVLSARGEGDLAVVVEAIGSTRTVGAPGNLGSEEHREHLVATAIERFGTVDHLVNNVGINPVYGPLAETDFAAAQKILETNVLATARLTQIAVAAGLGKRHGSIVNIASIAGLVASRGLGMYGISKSAVLGMTRQFAAELAPDVRVNAVAPAVIRTRFASALIEGGREEKAVKRYPLGRLGEPEDVAGPVVFLLSEAAGWITGQTIVIDGGASLLVGE